MGKWSLAMPILKFRRRFFESGPPFGGRWPPGYPEWLFEPNCLPFNAPGFRPKNDESSKSQLDKVGFLRPET